MAGEERLKAADLETARSLRARGMGWKKRWSWGVPSQVRPTGHGDLSDMARTWCVGTEVSITMKHVSFGWRFWLGHDVLTLG